MGRTLESKKQIRSELEAHLADTQMVMVIEYADLSVSEITKLRRQLRPSGTVCKVAKNTLMKKAIADHPQWLPMESFLKGASVCLLVKEDIAGALKAYQAFQKEVKKTELRGGVLEGQALNPTQLKAIADLPSKEVLMAQIAGGINGVATKLALAIKEVPQSLGRAIKAISEKEAA
jgi:large subunit ribosomal protein L10